MGLRMVVVVMVIVMMVVVVMVVVVMVIVVVKGRGKGQLKTIMNPKISGCPGLPRQIARNHNSVKDGGAGGGDEEEEERSLR